MTADLSLKLAQAALDWIVPDWGAPSHVLALATTRNGGVSVGARASLDIGAAIPVRDVQHEAVRENRRRLARFLPAEPVWLSQVHGVDVARIDGACLSSLLAAPPTADAAVTRMPGVVLGVRTADCLPVLFADREGTVVGAAHAGWRGLAAGILEATLHAMDAPPRDVTVWLGPAIGPRKFEVGRDVLAAFCDEDAAAAACFAPHREGKWLADLYGLARHRLTRAGVTAIAGGGYCTLSDSGRFFSYRGDRDTGRMATLVWLGAGA